MEGSLRSRSYANSTAVVRSGGRHEWVQISNTISGASPVWQKACQILETRTPALPVGHCEMKWRHTIGVANKGGRWIVAQDPLDHVQNVSLVSLLESFLLHLHRSLLRNCKMFERMHFAIKFLFLVEQFQSIDFGRCRGNIMQKSPSILVLLAQVLQRERILHVFLQLWRETGVHIITDGGRDKGNATVAVTVSEKKRKSQRLESGAAQECLFIIFVSYVVKSAEIM